MIERVRMTPEVHQREMRPELHGVRLNLAADHGAQRTYIGARPLVYLPFDADTARRISPSKAVAVVSLSSRNSASSPLPHEDGYHDGKDGKHA